MRTAVKRQPNSEMIVPPAAAAVYRSPTMQEVANACGVSKATVSFVLNDGPRPVSAHTRARVLDAMRRMNYHPNALARGMSKRRGMKTLGILFSGIEPQILHNQFAASILDGVVTAAALRGFSVTIVTTAWENAETSAPAFGDGRTDGVIAVCPANGSDAAFALHARGLPVVVASAPSGVRGVPSVDVDNVAIAQIAARHLLSLGHTRFAQTFWHANLPHTPVRRAAFRDALQQAGIANADIHDICADNSDPEASSGPSLRDLLRLPAFVRPTAVWAHNDPRAISVLGVAAELGLSVPRDLSVIGCDDLPSATLVTPRLTTIRQPLTEIGARAADLLMDRIENNERPRAPFSGSDAADLADPGADAPAIRFAPELVERASTAAPLSL